MLNDLLRVLGITYVFTFLIVLAYTAAELVFGKPTPPIEIVEVDQPKEEEQRPVGTLGLRKESTPGAFVSKPQERTFTNWPTTYQAAWLEQMQHEGIFREQDIHFAQALSDTMAASDTMTHELRWTLENGAGIEFQPTQVGIPTFEQGQGVSYPVPEAYRVSDEKLISLEDARHILDLSDARDPDNVAEAEDAWEIAHYLLETPTWQEVVKSEYVRPLEFTPYFMQIVWAVQSGEKKYGKLP